MKKIAYTWTIILVAVQLSFAGGPWTKTKGKYYIKLSQWWTIFDQHYTDTGLIDPNVTTGVFNTSIFLEYGITNRLTGVVNAPFLSRNYMNNIRSGTTGELIIPGAAVNGLGDIDLILKYGLSTSSVPVSVSIGFGIPTGITAGGSQENLQTGDGEFNQFIQFDAGTGFQISPKVPAYISAYTGLNNRTNGFSDEFRYGLEFGVGLLNQKLWLNTKLTSVESFKNGDTAETATSTSIFANNTEFLSIGLEANYYVTERLGVSIGTATAIRGEIIAAAPSYSIGVFYDFK